MAQPIESFTHGNTEGQKREGDFGPSFSPPLDVIAEGDSIYLEVVLPGVDLSDVTVERVEQMLVIHGERKDAHRETGASYHFVETRRGPFVRAIPLPFPLEADPPVELDRGILRIRLAVPKGEAGAKTKTND
jgi:HSP20 family protein